MAAAIGELKAFLNSEKPEVLCFHGKWGVGKSYAWDILVREARDKCELKLDWYSYVSLFGIDSLPALKLAIAEEMKARSEIGSTLNQPTRKERFIKAVNQLGRKSITNVFRWGGAKVIAEAVEYLAYLGINNALICIDDLERKGQHLSMKDVLGLISQLKEQKGCKVVLIVNTDALEGTDEADFELYHERVIDESVEFAPKSSECAAIAIAGGTAAQDLLRDSVLNLDVSNIRIIQKTERLVMRLAPLVEGFHPNVLRQAVQTLTLLCWSTFSGTEAPSVEFLRNKRGKSPFVEEGEMPENESGGTHCSIATASA